MRRSSTGGKREGREIVLGDDASEREQRGRKKKNATSRNPCSSLSTTTTHRPPPPNDNNDDDNNNNEQLLVPAEAAHAAAAAAGSLGALQFKDLNVGRPASQRAFASHVRRCDEMARALRFLDAQLLSSGAAFPASASAASSSPAAAAAAAEPLDALEARLADLERRALEASAGRERVARAVAELVELRAVLDVGGLFFSAARSAASAASLDDAGRARGGGGGGAMGGGSYAAGGVDAPLLTPAPPPADAAEGGGGGFAPSSASAAAAAASSRRLGFIAGTVADARRAGFERLLFRATRGNLLYRDAPVGRLADPATGEEADKHVFVVFFAGERARAKALKICEAYGANRYPYPGGDEPPQRAAAMAAEVDARLRELRAAVDAGDADRDALLSTVAAGIAGWSARVAKEKAIYHTLNKFSVDVTRKVLVGEAWCPVRARPAVAAALRAAANAALASGGDGGAAAAGAAAAPSMAAAAAPGLGGGSTVVFQPMLTYEQPPTHFATDKVSGAFQVSREGFFFRVSSVVFFFLLDPTGKKLKQILLSNSSSFSCQLVHRPSSTPTASPATARPTRRCSPSSPSPFCSR